MPLAKIPLEDICHSQPDPFGQSQQRYNPQRQKDYNILNIDLLHKTAEVGFQGLTLNFSLETGRPLQEWVLDDIELLYSALVYAYPLIQKELNQNYAQRAFGLDRKDLGRLNNFLQLAAKEKDKYLEDKKSQTGSFYFGEVDLPDTRYLGQKNQAHSYQCKINNSILIIKISSKPKNLYLFESSVTLKNANYPHFSSQRWVDSSKTSLEEEIDFERQTAENVNAYALEIFCR